MSAPFGYDDFGTAEEDDQSYEEMLIEQNIYEQNIN